MHRNDGSETLSSGVSADFKPIDITANCDNEILRGTERFRGSYFIVPKAYVARDENTKKTLFQLISKDDGNFILGTTFYIQKPGELLDKNKIHHNGKIRACDIDSVIRSINKSEAKMEDKINHESAPFARGVLAPLPLSNVSMSINGVKSIAKIAKESSKIMTWQGEPLYAEFVVSAAEKDEVLKRIQSENGLNLTLTYHFKAQKVDGFAKIKFDGKATSAKFEGALGVPLPQYMTKLDFTTAVAASSKSANIDATIEGDDPAFQDLAFQVVRDLLKANMQSITVKPDADQWSNYCDNWSKTQAMMYGPNSQMGNQFGVMGQNQMNQFSQSNSFFLTDGEDTNQFGSDETTGDQFSGDSSFDDSASDFGATEEPANDFGTDTSNFGADTSSFGADTSSFGADTSTQPQTGGQTTPMAGAQPPANPASAHPCFNYVKDKQAGKEPKTPSGDKGLINVKAALTAMSETKTAEVTVRKIGKDMDTNANTFARISGTVSNPKTQKIDVLSNKRAPTINFTNVGYTLSKGHSFEIIPNAMRDFRLKYKPKTRLYFSKQDLTNLKANGVNLSFTALNGGKLKEFNADGTSSSKRAYVYRNNGMFDYHYYVYGEVKLERNYLWLDSKTDIDESGLALTFSLIGTNKLVSLEQLASWVKNKKVADGFAEFFKVEGNSAGHFKITALKDLGTIKLVNAKRFDKREIPTTCYFQELWKTYKSFGRKGNTLVSPSTDSPECDKQHQNEIFEAPEGRKYDVTIKSDSLAPQIQFKGDPVEAKDND
jgi:hypothetical protein